jgi:feruloyl esterase
VIGSMTLALLATVFQGSACGALMSLPLPDATVTSAQLVPEGPFVDPRGGNGPGSAPGEPIPGHCRVRLVLTPTPDSHIHVELWMPVENWNGRFMAVGNGGFGGSIQGYRDMQVALREGYATAGSDTGHTGSGGRFALGHPEKIVDFAWRAVHEMTMKSKQLIDVFYDQTLEYSYFKGCSTGGRQALMAAQRYPEDFDGIIAGALANRHIYMHTAGSARRIHLSRNPDQRVPAETARMVSDAVMNACDTLGEGFLNNPRQCSFDFSSLLCGEGSSGNMCLTPGQLETVKTFYGGLRNSAGDLIFSGQALGNPMGAQMGMDEGRNVSDTVRYWAFQDPDYDWRDFDLDRDMPIIDDAVGFVDAVDPDLSAFEANGGKLLLYAGWGDTSITPENTVLYYEGVLDTMGPDQDDWMRLFMVPGMGHCRGGPGPDSFDPLGTLDVWRSEGRAPDQMMGTNNRSGLTRPLCPYPHYAAYDLSGNLADASNWACVAP